MNKREISKEKKETELNYKIVTKEELEAKIKARKLSVSYYTPVWGNECAPVYDNLLSLLTESQMLISGASIYYDIEYYDGPALIKRDELYRMFYNSDVIIVRKLDDLISVLEKNFLRLLVDIHSEIELVNIDSKKELYIIDYENKNFIEINIDLLLYHYFEEIRDPEMICDDFLEISRKYYDGKL